MIKALDRKWLLHNLPNLFTGEWYSWSEDNQGDGSIKKHGNMNMALDDKETMLVLPNNYGRLWARDFY